MYGLLKVGLQVVRVGAASGEVVGAVSVADEEPHEAQTRLARSGLGQEVSLWWVPL